MRFRTRNWGADLLREIAVHVVFVNGRIGWKFIASSVTCVGFALCKDPWLQWKKDGACLSNLSHS